jgi:two-component system nitrogen regulation sensor histidine kinase GlnL
VLDRVRKVAETSFARACHLRGVFDPSLPPVLGDRDQLIQVFMNLVRNASDAVPESGGEITLDHRLSPRRARERRVSGDAPVCRWK